MACFKIDISCGLLLGFFCHLWYINRSYSRAFYIIADTRIETLIPLSMFHLKRLLWIPKSTSISFNLLFYSLPLILFNLLLPRGLLNINVRKFRSEISTRISTMLYACNMQSTKRFGRLTRINTCFFIKIKSYPHECSSCHELTHSECHDGVARSKILCREAKMEDAGYYRTWTTIHHIFPDVSR